MKPSRRNKDRRLWQRRLQLAHLRLRCWYSAGLFDEPPIITKIVSWTPEERRRHMAAFDRMIEHYRSQPIPFDGPILRPETVILMDSR